jgi:hypothetical protein
MTLKNLAEHFETLQYYNQSKRVTNQFLLLNKRANLKKTDRFGYLCTIEKKGNNFRVIGPLGQENKFTGKIQILKDQIESYVKSLPYDSDYYMPILRDGIFEQHIIHDYLKSIGFDNKYDDTYVLLQKNCYKYSAMNINISISGLSDTFLTPKTSDTITIILHTGDYSWVEVKSKRDVEEIKKAIDSLLKPLLISESVNSFKTADKMKNAGDINITMSQITRNLQLASQDYKSELKNQLMKLAATL